MKRTIFQLSGMLLMTGAFFLASCGKENLPPPNPLLGKWQLDSNYAHVVIESQNIDYVVTEPAVEETFITFATDNFAHIQYSDTTEIRPYTITGDSVKIQLNEDMPGKLGFKLPSENNLELGFKLTPAPNDPQDPVVQRLDQKMYFHKIEN